MQHRQIFILLLLSLLYLTACTQENDTRILFRNSNYLFPYKLAEPDKSWNLPETLVEISGLGFIDHRRLACVQDEKGSIYIYNLKAEKTELKIDFGDDGDYEGIEIIDRDAWVLKSNGTLYKVTDYLKKAQPDVKKYTTVLSGKNNTEGLAYDPVQQKLLIACKGHPYADEKRGAGYKSIYSFNLETKLLDINPFLLIDPDTVGFYKNNDAMTRLGLNAMALLNPSRGDFTFQPSGIAVHPKTGHIYILGSVGNLLLVLTRKGQFLAVISLQSMNFPQPEGICFSPDGTLYIANEGNGQSGTLLKFEPKK